MGRRPRGSLPQMRRHAASGTARVRIGYQEISLGRWGSAEAHSRYHAIVRQFMDDSSLDAPPPKTEALGMGPVAVGPIVDAEQPSPTSSPSTFLEPPPTVLTVADLCARYMRHAQTYFIKPDGTPSSTIDHAKMGVRALRRYDDVPASEFGPLLLRDLMEHLVRVPLKRGKDEKGNPRARPRANVNRTVKSIRQIFKWAVSMELVPPTVHTALGTVPLLVRGRTVAPELPERQAVPDRVMEATLPHLPRMIADMVRLHRLIGCRPGELCRLRPCELEEVERDGSTVLVWRPGSHKNAWRGQDAQRFIGPKGRAILQPYLDRNSEEYCFIASESERERNAERRAARKSPMTPSHRARRAKAARRARARTPITEHAYRRAVTRACEKHGIPKWTPHQLRHAAAEEARRELSLDAAQARIGTKTISMTQHYAKMTQDKGVEVARRLG